MASPITQSLSILPDSLHDIDRVCTLTYVDPPVRPQDAEAAIKRADDVHDFRTFKCQVCGCTESAIIKFK
jgi:hypothetical protein